LKIAIVLLAAYAIVGVFHSCREYYRRQQLSPLDKIGAEIRWGRHRWFMCGLTWLPVSIMFPFMQPPMGENRWFPLKDSLASWLLFAAAVYILWRL
jgi:hypothetical protein